jgi:hypothetical protein
MEDIGLRDVAVMDRYEMLYGAAKPEKTGLYDLIIPRNPN